MSRSLRRANSTLGFKRNAAVVSLIAAQINAAVKVAELHTKSMHAANRVRREQGYQDAYGEEAFSRTADALAASVRALAARAEADAVIAAAVEWAGRIDGAPDADYRAQAESVDRLIEAVRCYEAALRQKVGAL
jgi:hypothetical protein